MTGAQDRGCSECAVMNVDDKGLGCFVPLPNELVGSILTFLDLHDLRAAAAVCRQFYNAAWRAGLYIERVSSDMTIWRVQADVVTWTELVEHALSKDLRLALTLECSQPEYQSDTRGDILEMLSAVSRSLPVLLALSVTVPDSMFHETCAVLHHPAPRLRSFSLSLNAHDSNTSISRSTGLFSGYAPCLREVRLGCPVVDACALPIFANVARLSAHSWQCSPAVSLSLHFPKLKHLYVHSSSEDPEIPPRWIDPSGVTLTSLAFKDNRWRRDQSCVTRSLEGVSAGIPVLHHFCHDETFMNWQNPPGWTGTARGSINVYLKGPSNELNMLVCPADHTWRRSYIFQFFDSETPIPLDDIPGLSARLEYLRLDDVVLLGFLLCGATFPALRRVRIDVADTRMAWSGWAPPQALFRGSVYSAQGRVRCPALTALALSAVHPWWEPGPDDSRDVSLRLSDVVRLCSALGLAEKPALELYEVRVDLPARCEPNVTTLHDIFSRISYLPWYCDMPCPVFNSALWEDNDTIATDRYIRQSLAR